MKQALISVSDKTNIVQFVKGLVNYGYTILSTGGTKRVLEENGLDVLAVEEITNTKEMLDGRVKTLHPAVHGALLARRDLPDHMKQLESHNINPIDIVCVNLYPFEETTKKDNIIESEAIEQIDIGGPSILRSAAKNFQSVTVVSNINQYDKVLKELALHGDTLLETRRQFAKEVFYKTAQYDQNIAKYFEEERFPNNSLLSMEFNNTLRYGENPHQQAAVYKTNESNTSILKAEQLHGKALSYNNIQDANAAISMIRDFKRPTAIALKHMNPCGIASANSISDAFDKAYASDEVSIFGGIVALNRNVTADVAKKLNSIFLEVVIAPSFSKDALEILKKKKNVRLLQLDTTSSSDKTNLQYTTIDGGMLVQEEDTFMVNENDLEVVTISAPSNNELKQALFAWNVVKHVKSNAVVVTKNTQTVGIGAGQMNRVGAAKIALDWAKEHDQNSDLILASDAFFPFDDVVKLAHTYGVKTIIQPGGSIRDQESIDACNELGMTMIFTHHRHFKH